MAKMPVVTVGSMLHLQKYQVDIARNGMQTLRLTMYVTLGKQPKHIVKEILSVREQS